MMYVIIALGTLCAILGVLVVLLITQKTNVVYRERYIDTSGVSRLPQSYIEVEEGRTLNLKVGKQSIIIPLALPQNYFRFRGYMYKTLEIMNEAGEYDNVRNAALKQLCDIVAELSYSKRKKKTSKALYMKAVSDIEWFDNVLTEMLDYWQTIDGKKKLLRQMVTPREMGFANWRDYFEAKAYANQN